MVSPLSAPVLATTTLVTSPALWAVWQGTMPFGVGLSRFLVVQGACWAIMSIASAALRTPRVPPAGQAASPQSSAQTSAQSSSPQASPRSSPPPAV